MRQLALGSLVWTQRRSDLIGRRVALNFISNRTISACRAWEGCVTNFYLPTKEYWWTFSLEMGRSDESTPAFDFAVTDIDKVVRAPAAAHHWVWLHAARLCKAGTRA